MFLNLVDVLIIGVLVYFAVQGYRSGFLAVIAQLISFVGSLFIALRSYSFIAGLLREHFMISLPVSNAVGFLIAAVVSELILGLALYFIIERIPPKVLRHSFWKVLGVFPSMIEGLVISAFVLTFTMALPIQPRYKEAISNSKIGNEIVTRTMHVELAMREVFGDVIDDTLTYLTIRPQSTEVVNLNTQVGELSIDENAETEMYKMVNQERLKEGAEELEWDPNLVPPARAHARDMFLQTVRMWATDCRNTMYVIFLLEKT
jgi:membrane protein required for colicin V production